MRQMRNVTDEGAMTCHTLATCPFLANYGELHSSYFYVDSRGGLCRQTKMNCGQYQSTVFGRYVDAVCRIFA